MIALALVDSAKDGKAHPVMLGWGEFVKLLTDPQLHAGSKETLPAWVPALFDSPVTVSRQNKHVVSLTCLVFDLDTGEPLQRVDPLSRGYKALCHTSWSHHPIRPRARVVFPLDEPCPVALWAKVWAAARRWAATFGITVDPKCKDPCRLYFLPAVPTGDTFDAETRRGDFWSEDIEGIPLSWRWLLEAFPEPPRAVLPPPVPLLRHTGLPGQDMHAQRMVYAAAVVRTRVREIESTPEGGGRNDLTFKAGCAVGQLVAAGVLRSDEGRTAIVGAAMYAGLNQSEAETAFQSGLRRGTADGPWPF